MRIFLIGLSLIISCSHQRQAQREFAKNKTNFNFVDTTGEYLLTREIGTIHKTQNGQIYLKSILTNPSGDEDKALEKIITFSDVTTFSSSEGNIKILKPFISQFSVWLEGEKYFSQLKVNEQNKELEMTLIGPDKKSSKTNFYKLPNKSDVLCFFSQIPECVKISNFLELSVKRKAGKMNFTIIWDRFPYMQEYYTNIPNNEIHAHASFSYDGITEDGLYRFVLKIINQSVFYHFDKELNFSKKFWVAQGISQVKL